MKSLSILTSHIKNKSFTQISKRISYLLKRSFFSISDLLVFKERKAVSIVKKIAKTENIYLSKKEAKKVLKTLQLIEKNKKIKVSNFFLGFLKLFPFVKDKVVTKINVFVLFFINFFSYLFVFRLNDQKIFRN